MAEGFARFGLRPHSLWIQWPGTPNTSPGKGCVKAQRQLQRNCNVTHCDTCKALTGFIYLMPSDSNAAQGSYISHSIHPDIMPVDHCPQSSWPSPVNDIFDPILNIASMPALIIAPTAAVAVVVVIVVVVIVVIIIIIITTTTTIARKISRGSMQHDWSIRSNVSPARGRKELPMHQLPWRSCTPACSRSMKGNKM